MKILVITFSLLSLLQSAHSADPWHQGDEENIRFLYLSKYSSKVQSVMANFANYKKYYGGESNYPDSSYVLPINTVVDKNQILRFSHRAFKPKRCYRRLKKFLNNSSHKYSIHITGRNFFDWKRSEVNFHISSLSQPSFKVTCGLNKRAVVAPFRLR
ncbi:hypothetical protein N9N67_04750 [Bacteriovoracaceae bacterium]|nr:hypothetical protein [Bacteriovoracaceae bacterium]